MQEICPELKRDRPGELPYTRQAVGGIEKYVVAIFQSVARVEGPGSCDPASQQSELADICHRISEIVREVVGVFFFASE